MKIQAIIAAAGMGRRLGQALPKPFVMVHGRPVVAYTLRVLEKCSLITSMIVVVHPQWVEVMEKIVEEVGLKKIACVVLGGEQRSDSVNNALKMLDADTDTVLVHDGARPLITEDFVQDMIAAAEQEGAVIAALPVKPTIKQVDSETMIVQKTLDRSCLWDVQTPQIFKRALLDEAYARRQEPATDDAVLVERLGKTVKIFPGLEQNRKITTPEDLFFAERMLGV